MLYKWSFLGLIVKSNPRKQSPLNSDHLSINKFKVTFSILWNKWPLNSDLLSTTATILSPKGPCVWVFQFLPTYFKYWNPYCTLIDIGSIIVKSPIGIFKNNNFLKKASFSCALKFICCATKINLKKFWALIIITWALDYCFKKL